MKIAVACNGNLVSEHFGHCQQFALYEIDNQQVVNKQVVDNPGHKPGFLPVFLHEKGANVIIAGGMGEGAVNLFRQNNMEIMMGISGDADEAVERYLKGQLVSSESICHAHMHHGEGCQH